jgi:ApbE superfamily uncharacterized protein (UPF0280 family)
MMAGERFISFTITYLETDLWIGINPSSFHPGIPDFVLAKTKELRTILDKYISVHPEFLTSLVPISPDLSAHPVIQAMINATFSSGTGPMSAVAGAFAQFVGEAIVTKFNVQEILVENGGDIYLSIQNDLEVVVFAGTSPLSNKLAVIIPATFSPMGLCTSSGTVGHSLSFGKADAAMIGCKDTALADAYATRFGNEVKNPGDIPAAIKLSESFPEILSILLIAGDQLGIRGKFRIKPVGI